MILDIGNIYFRYNSRPVLEGVKFTVQKGSILGVLGVNGAGKSTLLKCLNRIHKPQRGTVFWEQKNVIDLCREEIARLIGYVPQKNSEDSLTVFDAILLGRRPYIKWTVKENDLQVVERVINLLDLTELALRPLNRLSGGEIQKVMIARALAQEPEILLLDEPFSNLDIRNQLEVMLLLKKAVKEQKLTAVIAIHDINWALRFADCFLLLKDGRVHTFGDKSALTPAVIEEIYGVRTAFGQVNGFPVLVALEC